MTPAPLERSSIVPLHPAAFASLQTVLRVGDLYVESEAVTQSWVSGQMTAMMAALEAARSRPDQAAAWTSHARALWNRTDESYDREGRFYHKTVPPPDRSVCIDTENNGWALMGALAVEPFASADLKVGPRIDELLTTLRELLLTQRSRGGPACPAGGSLPLVGHSVPLLALLDARASRASAGVAAVVRQDVDQLLKDHFRSNGFHTENLYQNFVNAQLLIVLIELAEAFDLPEYVAARDALFLLIHDGMVERVGEAAIAYDLQNSTGTLTREGEGRPANQLWTALAFEAYEQAKPGSVEPGTVERLVEELLARFWDPTRGAFRSEGGIATLADAAVPAMFSRGPTFFGVVPEPPSLAIVVPSRLSFDYTDAPDGASYVFANVWNVRFNLAGNAPGQTQVLFPVSDLAPMSQPDDFVPRVLRVLPGGTTQAEGAVETLPGAMDLLRMTTSLSTSANPFRYGGTTPLEPVRSEIGPRIGITVANKGPQTVTVGTLQLDLAAKNFTVLSVSNNDVPVTATPEDRVVNEQLSVPHMRLTLNGLHFPAQSHSFLEFAYRESEPPTILNPSVTRDSAGNDPYPGEVPQGQSAYIVATVTDNVVLRQVQLRFQMGDTTVTVFMEEVPGEPRLYAARLPSVADTGDAVATIVAIDASGNLKEQPVRLSITNPLLVGNQILFVFSGILFFSALVIWLKVRRKGTP